MSGQGITTEFFQGNRADRSALEDVVLDSSRTLMSAQPDEFGTKLRWALGNVGEALGAHRCATYQATPEGPGSTLSLTHEWTATGVSPHAEAARVLDADRFPWLFERLDRFENVDASPVDDLPAAANALRRVLEADGTRSAILMPLVVDWTLLGAVGFEAVRVGGRADAREVTLARTFSDMIGHAIERTRRERALRRKNDRLEEFASVVSHDLRNPLNVIQASIGLAREESSPGHLDRAAEAADRMERIVEGVLTLARVGQDIGETEPVAPHVLAERAWESIQAVEATLVTDETEPVCADPERLVEAFENLFRNAVEHGGSEVTVRVGPLEAEPGFVVADDGRGIPPADRDAVFEHGYSTAADGTGLGLSIVSRIVAAHGWAVAVDEASAGGARFEVRTDPEDES